MSSATVIYKDFWFKIIGSLLASYIIDALDREESFFQRLGSKYFYTDILGGFVIALILWEMVRFTTRYLDKKFSWAELPLKRILLQLVIGVLVPSLFSFIFTLLWMRLAYNQDIFQTSWLYNEFYTVIILILLINVVYFSWWLFLNQKQIASANKSGIQQYLEPVNTVLEVSKGGKTILLPHVEIAYSYLNNGYCYVRPEEGENFVTTYTLDEINRQLGEKNFFRVNRQMLISRKACTAYKSIENGKIELELILPYKTPVIVSQKRAKEFRKWISGAE